MRKRRHVARADPLRVVRVYLKHPPLAGGMEQHIARLSAQQRRLGVSVLNVFHAGSADGDHIRILKSLDLLGLRPAVLRNLIFYAGIVQKLRMLRSSSPTVLHVHGGWSDFLLGAALAKLIGAKAMAASIHGKLHSSHVALYRWGLRPASMIFATGRREAEVLERVLRRPVEHLPSAPADLFFEPTENDPDVDVVAVGNLVPVKQFDLLLACARLRPDLRFAIAGEGPLRATLRTTIEAEGLENVALLGRLSQSEVRSLLARSKVFVSTSSEEGTPTSALEAMACGLPVILTPANDFRWLVSDGQHGFVTAGWDPQEIVAKLDTILADEHSRKAIGRRNRERARQYSWTSIGELVTARMEAVVAVSSRVPA